MPPPPITNSRHRRHRRGAEARARREEEEDDVLRLLLLDEVLNAGEEARTMLTVCALSAWRIFFLHERTCELASMFLSSFR